MTTLLEAVVAAVPAPLRADLCRCDKERNGPEGPSDLPEADAC